MAAYHEGYLQKFLRKNKKDAYLSTELIEVLKHEYPDLEAANARKIISSAKKNRLINCSNPITFLNNQYAYFSEFELLDYSIIKNSIKKYKKNLHRVIFALERNKGIITLLDAKKISGSTLQKNTHNSPFESILNDLKYLKLAEEREYGGVKYLIMLKSINLSINEYRDMLKDKNLLLFLSLSSLIKSNLIDQEQLCYMGTANEYNGIERNGEIWDAFGFSNSVGIGNSNKEYSTLVLIDFLSEHQYEEYDFAGFKDRVDRVIFSTKGEKRKVLPIILYKSVSLAAYTKIHENNYLLFSIEALLSKNAVNIARTFNKNVDIIENKISEVNVNINSEVVSSLDEIEKGGNADNYANLKGQLFEYLMFPVIHKIYSNNAVIQHSYLGSLNGKKFECDYMVETEDECIIIELKGYKRNNEIQKGSYDNHKKKYEKNTIMWFINQTFNLCKESNKGRRKFKFCYITTAKFSEEARKELNSRKKNKPNDLESSYNGEELLSLLKKYELCNEINLINNYYT